MEENFYSVSASLGSITMLDVAAMETIYRLECSGEQFYNLLAERIGNDEAAELLRRNGREELAHARRIAKALSIRLGREWEPSAEVSELLPIPLPADVTPDLFLGIVQGELNGDAGYQAWADKEEDPEVEKLLRLNGREETIHAERVRKVLEILGA
ncbi:MAG: ferritin-like domain-containing protein [Actinomycetota bacterium]